MTSLGEKRVVRRMAAKPGLSHEDLYRKTREDTLVSLGEDVRTLSYFTATGPLLAVTSFLQILTKCRGGFCSSIFIFLAF
jgi:hypothetical protein